MVNGIKTFPITLLFLVICTFLCAQKIDKEVERPNIILIMADDLGWGDVGFNGNMIIRTPHLDQLASRGIIFNRFYAAAPVCSPTRASCLTGRNPYRQGIYTANTGHLKKEEITLPEILKEEGYQTGIFGKWHLGTLTTKEKDANRGNPGITDHYSTPSMHGFEEYAVTESKVPTYDPLIYPATFDKTKGESLRYGWSAIENRQKSNIYGTSYWIGKDQKANAIDIKGENTKIIMDKVLPFIQKAITENIPFFTVIWIHTPHLPVVADKKYRSLYAKYSHKEQLYYGSISAMDAQIGRLSKFLKEKKTAGKFRGKKRDLYEGGLRVPAFCVWPGRIPAGTKTNTAAVTSDYLPTIKAMLNIKYHVNVPIDGINLTNIIKGNQTERKSPIGFQYPNKVSWVTDTYKIIQNSKNSPFEMYNLKNDPSEQFDIIFKNTELAAQLKSAMFEWVESCKISEKGLDYSNNK
jgi:arylsulfatase A-like enzyme